MAVYKRAYRPYEGPLTSERWRFLVLPRYAFQEIFESRVLAAFFVLCLVPFLIEAVVVYVANSDAARAMLRIPTREARDLMRPIFFVIVLTYQGFLAFFLAAWVAPVLISPDIVNGGLPLFLSRPLSRAEYVLGKMAVLMALLSAITWLPVLGLFFLQAGLAGREWLAAHLRVGVAIFAGAWIWIAVLTLLGLALSAWIRWRIVASGAMVGLFFMGSAFGEVWHEVLGNPWGRLVNPTYVIGLIWRDLFGILTEHTLAREMLDGGRDLPVGAATAAVVATCALCLWLLNRRLQAREVVS